MSRGWKLETKEGKLGRLGSSSGAFSSIARPICQDSPAVGSSEQGWPTIRKWKLCQYLHGILVNLFFFLLNSGQLFRYRHVLNVQCTIGCAANHCGHDKMKTKK